MNESLQQVFELQVTNCPTILLRVIQSIKNRGIEICHFSAKRADAGTGILHFSILADDDKAIELRQQLEKMTDVKKTKVEKYMKEEATEFPHHNFIPAY